MFMKGMCDLQSDIKKFMQFSGAVSFDANVS